MAIRLATDIGGTFTDMVAFDERSGHIQLGKAPSTPKDLAQGILDSLADSPVSFEAVSYFVHGCTVVINTVTERTGAKTALITTSGFRDVLEIGRGNRPDMYNLRFKKPVPFVPRHLRFEVRERVDHRGQILVPLQLGDLDPIVERCQAEGISAVAVCLLHSYANPEHERELASALKQRLPGVAVTVSHDVTQEWREYERSNTVVLNAYVMPTVQGYLDRVQTATRDRGLACPLHVMQSNGGTASFAMARQRPIYLIESGPVAGVSGAAVIGRAIGEPNLISLDIGGTTAKCSLIEGSEPKTTTEYRIEWTPLFPGYPVKTPVVDIVEIGAGGGSIGWLEDGEFLRVGPKSAGAEPGPACYGKGGQAPTVTDATLVAGVINPDNFLGGKVPLYPELARRALEQIAQPLGTTVKSAANGIIRIVNSNMTEALKLVSVRRGYDPRDFSLVAFGGGGPVHAAALAEELQLKNVIVPLNPAHFSAWGMLVTRPRVDVVRTRVYRISEVRSAEVEANYADLEVSAAERFSDDGDQAGIPVFQRKADLRYHGQEHTVPVLVGPDPLDLAKIEADFHEAHERLYTFRLPGTPVEFVNFHVIGYRQVRTPRLYRLRPTASQGLPREVAHRPVDFDVYGVHDTVVYARDQLPAGFSEAGPLIVEEAAATTLVHPGQRLSVDPYGNLIIQREA